MGRLAEIEKEYRGTGVKFLGVVTDVYGTGGDAAAEAKNYAESQKAEFPQVIQHTSLTRGLSYIPTTCIVNSSGKVLARYAGVLSHDEWINVIETLVNG